VRQSRLEVKLRLEFPLSWFARGTDLSKMSVREAVRRLIGHRVLRLVRRSKAGHVIEVRIPNEVRAGRPGRMARRAGSRTRAFDLDTLDFLKSPGLRLAIHARERRRCFYCFSRVTPATLCLDHVVPLVKFGDNSWRNLVSCCQECNSRKNAFRAADFLRRLHRERRLTDVELAARFRALDAVAAGKLRPRLPLEWIRRARGGV
jgi:5-methylcytosine-specific restriction endonuclease McrA